MILSVGQLRSIMARVSPARALVFCQPLNDAAAEFGFDEPRRFAAFLSQVAVESAELSQLVEGMNYSAEGLLATWPARFASPAEASRYAHKPELIAAHVYAGRLGNGDEAGRDGWTYRGRGLLQVTGRSNYRLVGAALGLPLEARPQLLEDPVAACRSAGFFWQRHGLNALADSGDLLAITRAINGGLAAFDRRRAYWACAKAALGV